MIQARILTKRWVDAGGRNLRNRIPEIKPHSLCHEEPQTDGAELDDLQRTRSGMSVKTQDYSHRSRLEPALQCTRLMIRILDRATSKSTSMREFLPLPSSYIILREYKYSARFLL